MKLTKGLILCVFTMVVLSCTTPSNDSTDSGTLKIRSYSDFYSDPSTITLDNPINAILDVEYPNGTLKTIVTDGLGFYDFGIIQTGTYRIKPRYITNASTTEIYVGKNENITKTILIPSIEIAFYLINGNKSPVNDISIREALTKAIIRQQIITTAGINASAMYNLIPAKLSGSWCSGALNVNESLSDSQTIIGQNILSVTLSYNNNVVVNQPIAVNVQLLWKNIGTNVTVNLNGISWNDLIIIRDVNKTFEIARGGWEFDSNNPLSLFKVFLSIDTVEYQNLLQQTETSLSNGQFTEFESGIVLLNNYIMNNYLVIPFYQYN